MRKSPRKIASEEGKAEDFEAAVTRLTHYLLGEEKEFKYRKIHQISNNEPEYNFNFENVVIDDLIEEKNEDVQKLNNVRLEDNFYKIECINNAIQNQVLKSDKSKYNYKCIRNPEEIMKLIEENQHSKIVSERLAKSRTTQKRAFMDNDMKYFNIVTDKQQLFKDREKFRQNYNK
ncbi:hypothetical protein TVAG_498920 [Trichomonas vaginalis G3]|uniref:Uncharacterized protein n=1 Tax=Trichomonas vaginalis (strain ATCC PRA-98 / G3) TaxID=412133 RepID=A2FCJ9_TRIV3|nr:hypothetical protein TVAGG3_0801240 [Trichomonas vaginalis G3]EAX97358.1 hypothetical protein TVAG_498920 [Trichomonas vaginalis G3]KAI5496518.1 hypothetical protein TVAGG3_0801240 [Trichomonas vaginalis G3]|eukprot:XP_001310288.1 hypothetical protein [Trichomonas vaginalis G3]